MIARQDRQNGTHLSSTQETEARNILNELKANLTYIAELAQKKKKKTKSVGEDMLSYM